MDPIEAKAKMLEYKHRESNAIGQVLLMYGKAVLFAMFVLGPLAWVLWWAMNLFD